MTKSKRPSERIYELVKNKIDLKRCTDEEWSQACLESIIQVMDEEYERKGGE